MIHVIATIELAEGRREDFLKEFALLVPKVRAEAGCVDYGPTVDVETNIPAQGPQRLDVVTVVERWEDLESLEAHLMATHMIEFRKAVKDLVQATTLQILRPA